MMDILLDLTVIFVAAAVMQLIMDKFNHPSVPAYIIAGLLAGTIISESDLLNLAQIGIAFLVFIFGLKYNPKNLKAEANATLGTSIIQMTFAGSIGFLMATLLGFDPNNAFYFAAAAAISSSLVGLELSEKAIHSNLLHGRLSESLHFIQDMVAFALIAITMATTVESAINALVYSALILGAAILFRDYIFERLAKQTGGNHELLTMASLTLLIGFIGLSELLNISMVLGAFAAGIAASKFPYNIELLDTMGSIKDFFSAIFFVVLGALVTLPSQIVVASATALVVITMIITPMITYLGLKYHGYDNRTALLTGLSLDQISELVLIITIQGFLAGLITPVTFESIILAATATMLISSYTKKHEEQIYQTFTPKREERISFDLKDHIILVGHDVQGAKIAEALEKKSKNYIVIENDPEKVSSLREKDIKVVYGDIMDNITWREANYEKADLVISTVPSEKVNKRVLDLDKPDDKIVRAETSEKAIEYLNAGALHTIIPDKAANEKLLEHMEEIAENPKARENLRRESLLEFKKYLHQ